MFLRGSVRKEPCGTTRRKTIAAERNIVYAMRMPRVNLVLVDELPRSVKRNGRNVMSVSCLLLLYPLYTSLITNRVHVTHTSETRSPLSRQMKEEERRRRRQKKTRCQSASINDRRTPKMMMMMMMLMMI